MRLCFSLHFLTSPGSIRSVDLWRCMHANAVSGFIFAAAYRRCRICLDSQQPIGNNSSFPFTAVFILYQIPPFLYDTMNRKLLAEEDASRVIVPSIEDVKHKK